MNDVVFLSGWAGPESLFPGLSGRLDFAVPFLDGDEAAVLTRLETTRAKVLCGWSTGAHIILKYAQALFSRFDRSILCAPFLRFGDSLPARITSAMAAGMTSDPEGVTRAFWKNCGIDVEPTWDPAWAGLLTAGLDFLLTSAAPATPVEASHVTVLHGEADRIVRRPAVAKVMDVLGGTRLISMPGGHFPDLATLTAQLFG